MFLFHLLELMLVLHADTTTLPYNMCKKNCENIFVWNRNESNFLSLYNVTLLNNYKHNLETIRGKTVRVLADNMLPYITSSNYSQKLGGFLGDIWQIIESRLGFRSNISSVYFDTGLDLMASGKADVFLAGAVVKRGLVNVKFSQPYFYNWYHLFVKTPEGRASSGSYLKTFDNLLWLVTFIVIMILTVTVWLTTKILNSVCKIEPGLSPVSCFLGIVAGFINQGFDLKLSSYSGRIQVMFALMLGVVLYSALNAVLVAQLAVFDIPFPFASMEDIADKRTHSLCLRPNSFVYNNFTDEKKELLPRWKGILNGKHCKDITSQRDLADIVCKDSVAILENRAVIEMILKNYNLSCKLVKNTDKLFTAANSFLMLKGFRGNKLIDNLVQKMRTTGILQRLEYVWIRQEKVTDLTSPETPQINFDHIYGLLVMYFIVLLISLLLLVFEISHFRYTHPIEFIYIE